MFFPSGSARNSIISFVQNRLSATDTFLGVRIALTGSAGFIGKATRRLLENPIQQVGGHVVIPIDRSTGHDLLDSDLDDLIGGCDSVIHLAGVLGTSELFDTVGQAVDVNVRGTLNVIEAASRHNVRYVGITMPDCWPSIYQATKLCGVRIAAAYQHAGKLRSTHVRAFNAYGDEQKFGDGHPQKIIPTFASLSWQGKPMPIWGDGDQTCDLVHVEHIAYCLARAAVGDYRFDNGDTWDAGSGKELTVLQVAKYVGSITGSTILEHLPMRVGELPGTQLCATDGGPFRYDEHPINSGKLAKVIEAYKT